MKVTSSYAVEIKKQKTFDDTIKLYREAVSFLINCLNNEWTYIQTIGKAKEQLTLPKSLSTQQRITRQNMISMPNFISFPVTYAELLFKRHSAL